MEELESNPYQRTETDYLLYPHFPRKATSFYLSQETIDLLNNLAKKLVRPNASISELIEAIGMCALQVSKPEFKVDPESGTTTEDCRSSGYLDAQQGNLPMFLTLYGNMSNEFELAYMRGFYEGKYMKGDTE